MLGWRGKHEPGKHVRQGEPSAGNNGPKPELTEVEMQWPNGAVQDRQTNNIRESK